MPPHGPTATSVTDKSLHQHLIDKRFIASLFNETIKNAMRCLIPDQKFGNSKKRRIFAVRSIGSDGRAVRHSSAKAATAVRFRFRPHRNRVVDIYNAVSFYIIISSFSSVYPIPSCKTLSGLKCHYYNSAFCNGNRQLPCK